MAGVTLALLIGAALWSAPAASAHGSGSRYLIRRGDTLSDVAVRFHTSVRSIANANGIGDADRIYAGNYLTIPAGSGGGSAGTYVVQPGDTLWGVAKRYGVSVSALAGANGLSNPDMVRDGRTLTIPGQSGSSSSAVPAVSAASYGGDGIPARLRNEPGRYASYAPLFEHWAAHYGVSLSLLKGLCWLESGWQQSVVSSTGAIGICQLMPQTTSFLSSMIGAQMNPWSASDNIRMSARYLRYLLDRSGGNVRTAVAAYYQGFDSVTSRGMYNDTVAYVEGVLAFQQRF